MSGVYILGASGHGKVVLSIFRSGNIAVAGFFDDAPGFAGRNIWGVPVLGDFNAFGGLFVPQAVIAVGNGLIRRRISERFDDQAKWIVAVHTTAWIDSSVRVGSGAVVCAGAVVQPDTTLGEHCIINTGATVDHDCRIGSFSHVCPGVHLGGNVTIGEGAWLGIGSQAVQGITIGRNALIGAGATVVGDIPDNAVAMGTPARVTRFLPC